MSVVPVPLRGQSERRTRRSRRPPLIIGLSFLIVAIVGICAIAGSWIAPRDPNHGDLLVGIVGPNQHFWLGTDDLGRDVLARTIVGARTAMIGPIVIALGALVIGNVLGLLAGYFGGIVDAVIMRWVDLMYSIPPLLIAVVVAGVIGSSYALAVALLVLLTAPYDTRIVRGATLEQRPLPYVEAARTLGVSDRRIMLSHIWPNVLPIVIANSFLNFAFSIVTLSSLSFLGLGAGPATPDWGRMLADSRSLLFDNAATALAPGIMIILTAVSMNLIGDWIYERLADRGRAR
jgi:peptide/nickel transport system permease protein